ncbi:MAG: exostosin family protein [Alphaproteobacteria bacterium]
MKIHILPTPRVLRPIRQAFRYPADNPDYGVEQDFLQWLRDRPGLCTDDPNRADFHYLPVFWTRYHINHGFGKTGQAELRRMVGEILIDDAKTFTICQYDDGPLIDLGQTLQFLAARKTGLGIDIPVLRSTHRLPWWRPKPRYLASFVGRLLTHPIRREMAETLKGQEGVLLIDGDKGPRFFVKTTLASHVCLAPRGYGGSSFRCYEAMQLGVLPLVINDLDTRPFRKFLDWSTFSLFTHDPTKVPDMLRDADPQQLLHMGQTARKVYNEHLAMGRWCRYVLEELKLRF